eukprot:Selendium_serpulae@DN4834_c0_g1_i1.p1
MEPELIRRLALAQGGYETEHLNAALLLGGQGFTRIENLEPYTDLVCLMLHNNCISEIDGISHLRKLQSLYLQSNGITGMAPISALPSLIVLDLSCNSVEEICGLEELKCLETLKLGKNNIRCFKGLRGLSGCSSLQTVDVSFNQITAVCTHPCCNSQSDISKPMMEKERFLIELISLFRSVPIRCLQIHGNPFSSEIGYYRTYVVSGIPTLRFLDERPVQARDRLQFSSSNSNSGKIVVDKFMSDRVGNSLK